MLHLHFDRPSFFRTVCGRHIKREFLVIRCDPSKIITSSFSISIIFALQCQKPKLLTSKKCNRPQPFWQKGEIEVVDLRSRGAKTGLMFLGLIKRTWLSYPEPNNLRRFCVLYLSSFRLGISPMKRLSESQQRREIHATFNKGNTK